MQINVLEEYGEEADLKVVGDIHPFVAGSITKESLQRVKSSDFLFALGGSTLDELDLCGETLILYQNVYISRLNPKGPLKCLSRHGEFETFFLVGLDIRAKPFEFVEVISEEPVSVQDLYSKCLERHPGGVAIAGEGLFPSLDMMYLRRPPIDGQPFYDHQDRYIGSETREFALAFLFGVALGNDSQVAPVEMVGRIFYDNPLDKEHHPFKSHTHLALLSEREQGGIELDRDTVGIRHLLNASRFTYGRFSIYKLKSII